jgi:hypothetical protein
MSKVEDQGTCGCCGNKGSNDQALRKCTQCSAVSYCSRECQAKHWKQGGHRAVCKTLQKKQSDELEGQWVNDLSVKECRSLLAAKGIDSVNAVSPSSRLSSAPTLDSARSQRFSHLVSHRLRKASFVNSFEKTCAAELLPTSC